MTVDCLTALKRAVKELKNSGLRTVDYASGVSTRVEVAARRAIMTGISQLSAKVTEDNMELLDTEYVEVTWHAGARPEHQPWQGRVYHWNRGGGGKSVDKKSKSDKMKSQAKSTLPVDIQHFAKKRSQPRLPSNEYGKIMHEINTLYHSKYKDKKVIFHYSGDYMYTLANKGFNNYIIKAKRKIK